MTNHCGYLWDWGHLYEEMGTNVPVALVNRIRKIVLHWEGDLEDGCYIQWRPREGKDATIARFWLRLKTDSGVVTVASLRRNKSEYKLEVSHQDIGMWIDRVPEAKESEIRDLIKGHLKADLPSPRIYLRDSEDEIECFLEAIDGVVGYLRKKMESATQRHDSSKKQSFREGNRLERISKDPKRSRTLREAKILTVLQETGRLACEVCQFEFASFYGPLGEMFAHVHHKNPLALSIQEGVETTLEDLAVVCANCHAIIHRGELMSVEALRKIVSNRRRGVV